MTDFGTSGRGPNDRHALGERLASARAAARDAAERYVQVRRDSQRLVADAGDILARTRDFRERLRESVTSYVAVLRVDEVPPERAIVFVKAAILESDALPDADHRQVVEEAVRWAVDAYYAA